MSFRLGEKKLVYMLNHTSSTYTNLIIGSNNGSENQGWSLKISGFKVHGTGVQRHTTYQLDIGDNDVIVGSTSHRYPEFVYFCSLLKSMYSNTSVSRRLPGMLPKDGKSATDPFSDAFLNQRKNNLNSFFLSLEKFPNLMDVPNAEDFLGLHIV